MPPIRTSNWRNRCINCLFLVPRNQIKHLVAEECSQSMVHILQSWIDPSQLYPDSIICTECLALLRNHANSYREESIVPLPAFGHKRVCIPCGASILRAARTYAARENTSQRNFLMGLVPPHLVDRMERVCAACWRAASRQTCQQPAPAPQEPVAMIPEPPVLLLIPEPPPLPLLPQPPLRRDVPKILSSVYRRAANTSTRCIFINCLENERLLIPTSIKEVLLLRHKFYVPAGARVCSHHLDHGSWNELTSEFRDFTGQQFDKLLKMMQNNVKSHFNFNNIETMPPHLCHYWLGINSEQFNSLLNNIPNLTQQVSNPAKALCIYLIKLRTGDSDERLATLFDMPRSTLERWMSKTRNCLSEDFVPQYLGFNHLNIQNVAARNKIIPEGFFGNPDLPPETKPAIAICDATYVFLQSSSNYLFQKQTYSLQKLDNLVKPFMIVCCDGYIIECLGPYKATINDANITSINLRNDDGMRSFFRRGDVFLLDRGFRDVLNELQGYGYVTHMPESLLEDEYQLTTQQANHSRLVTMCRWVVEVVNGRIKRDFRLFRHVFSNRAAMHLKTDFRICCALLNKFHVGITDPPEALDYVRIAREKLSLENHLGNYVIGEQINRRRAIFETIDSNHPHLNTFPRLTIDDHKHLALGTYQIKQARSYYGEHVRQSGIYSIEINNEIDEDVPLVLGLNNYMLRGRIKSRHVNSRTYYTYLLISKDDDVRNTLDAIAGHYCSCLVGRRTVGCCAHIMTVVWFLSWGRFNDISAPAPYLDHFFEDDGVF